MTYTRRVRSALQIASVPPEPVAGLRVASSLAVPFVLGVILSNDARWAAAANAAFLVALCNVGGSYRVRATVSLLAWIGVPITVFVAVLAGNHVWLAVPLGIVWAFAGSLTALWGNRYAFLGLTLAVGFVVYLNTPADLAEATELLWLSAVGAAWGALLSVAAWPVLRGRPARIAMANLYRAIGRLALAVAEGDDDWRLRSAAPRTRSLNLTADVLEDVIASPFAGRATLLALFERAHETGQRLVLLADRAGGLATATAAASREACETIAAGLAGDYRWWQWRGIHPERASLPECVAMANRLLADLGGDVTGTPHLRPRYAYSRSGRTRADRLRSNLSMDSLVFRHALRLAVAVAFGIGLFLLVDIPDGYWIPLTVLFVLRPDIGGTLDRAVQRSLATIVGAGIGALLAIMITGELALALILFPLAWCMRALLPLSYLFWVLAITPLVVVVRDTSHIGDWSLAVWRTSNTLSGTVLALVAGFLLWPSWTRLRLPVAVSRLMGSLQEWTVHVLRARSTARPDPDQLGFGPQTLHMRVLRDRTNVVLAVDQLGQELPLRPGYLGAAIRFELSSLAYVDAVAELADHKNDVKPTSPDEAGELETELANAFGGHPGEHPTEVHPSDDPDLDRFRRRLTDLVAARHRLEATPPTS